MKAPQDLINLYNEAQIAGDMDSEVNVAGNGMTAHYVQRVIEEVCRMVGIELPPRLTNADAEAILRATGREHEVEYLMGEIR